MMEVFYITLVGHQLHSNVNENGRLWLDETGGYGKMDKGKRIKKRYVLLISNSLDNAIRLLMPYKANLEFNKRIIQDYGLQESAGNWEMAEFTTLSGVAFRAIGAGQSPRGAKNEEARPDVIIFDDVDTDADCLNPEIIAKKWRWIEEAAIGTRSISQPTTILFCGNRIAADCCISRAEKVADLTDVVNIRDENGRSTWPEKNAEVDIDRVLSQKSYAAGQKEYFNNPLTEGAVFKKMAYKQALPLKDYTMLLCYTDPSYKENNDYKATVLVGKWEEEYHIIKCYLQKAGTAEMIDWHFQIMDLVGNNVCFYYIEEVFMQDVIRKELANARSRKGRQIPINGDTRKKPDKFMRIESALEPLHRNGKLYLNEREKENPNMELLAEQFEAFAPGSHAHDDGPDAVEGAIWLIADKESKGTSAGIYLFSRKSL
jgi:predicted phage terminase large subunit-like protein